MLNVLLASALTASQFVIEVENFMFDASTGLSQVVIRVTNNGKDTARGLAIACTFMDAKQKAMDIGNATFQDVEPGNVVFGKARAFLNSKPEYVSCAVAASY